MIIMVLDLKRMVLASVGREPIPIHGIAKAAGLSVQTTSKYCHILAAEKKVEIDKFGNMKLVKRK